MMEELGANKEDAQQLSSLFMEVDDQQKLIQKLVHLPHCYFVNDYKQKNQDVLDLVCQPKCSEQGNGYQDPR